MPSSYTDLGLEQQAAGENTNTWGAPKLNNALGRINNLIGGFYTVTLTGDYSLTTSNSSTSQADNTGRQALLKFNGTLSSNATITVPSVGMQWCVWNNTNKNLTFTTGAGTTVVVDAGDKNVIWCDGSNVHQIFFGNLGLKDYIGAISASAGAVPGNTGQAGKYLYTDGTNNIWRQPSTSDLSDYQTAIVGAQIAFAVAL